MPVKVVTDEAKLFIVKSLARYESISEISEAVKEKFGLTLKPQTIQHYDPTKTAGEDLDKDLKTLFFETRQKFDDEEILPLMKKKTRIARLSKYVEIMERDGNTIGAAGVIEQIAKEDGGFFTNRRQIEVKDVSKLTDEELHAIVNSKG